MEFIQSIIDQLLELLRDPKAVIDAFIAAHGTLVYVLLFAIIFVETGLVVMPFLPGDSLLFVAGTLAAGTSPTLNLWVLLPLLFVAAVLGDNVNYLIGRYFGHQVVKWKIGGRQLVRDKDMEKTHAYFEKYGPRTIIIARFIPIVRTLAPFAAGIGEMDYRRLFTPYNLIGGALWIVLLLLLGYAFGNHPWVQKNYESVILGIIFISVLPMIVEILRAWWTARTKVG